MPFGLNGKAIPVDDEGYVLDPTQWDERLAVEFAGEEGIVLSDEHWAVIRYMREYYEIHQIVPDARHVIRYLAGHLGGASTGRNDLFRLFPYGYVKQACRIAGMRRPRAWSTG